MLHRCFISIWWLIKQYNLVIAHQWMNITYFVQWCGMKDLAVWGICKRLIVFMCKPIIEETSTAWQFLHPPICRQGKDDVPSRRYTLLREAERLLKWMKRIKPHKMSTQRRNMNQRIMRLYHTWHHKVNKYYRIEVFHHLIMSSVGTDLNILGMPQTLPIACRR